ncbi:MAG: hypothetical protein JWP85_1949 [Rhodoglobus sp.]|nr:hypothetical protein [Rhodoglobus sp.]
MTARERRQKRKRDDFVRGYTQFAQRPVLPVAPIEAVWEKVCELIPVETSGKKSVEPAPKDEANNSVVNKRLKRTLRVLDVLAALAWFFVITKVCIADIDRLFFSWVAPQAMWLLDLRVFAVLGLASLLLLLFKRWKLGVGLAYVSFFPLVVTL